MVDGNYIKLSRKLLSWEWYSDINTTRVFIHCLLKANWKEEHWKGIVIGRGQLVTSLPSLEKDLGLTVSEIRTSLKHLKSTGEIADKAQARYRIITVINYDCYQSDSRVNDSEIAGKSQPVSSLLAALEEEKNINNISLRACERFEDFWNNYPKQVSRMLAEQAYAQLLLTTEGLREEQVVAAAKNYAEACMILGTQERFIKNPANWLNDSTWVDYTQEKYKKPVTVEAMPKPKNKFNDFPQRSYDFDALEKQMMGVEK